MDQRRYITIHQTLHGYNEGHRLLASSIELNATEKTILSQLSDSSGSGKERNFSTYLTGYPLPNSRFYALARTWYADEMPRPGCVWTQTLLIELSLIWMIRDFSKLLKIFERPKLSNYSLYSDSVDFDTSIPSSRDPDEEFYLLTCHYYSTDNKILLLSGSAEFYEKSILSIWNLQWPRLKRSFKFCSGSLSIRKIGGEVFDLQVIPYDRQRVLGRSDLPVQIVDPVNACISDWILDYRQFDLDELLDFMTSFGADLHPSKDRFALMVKIYGLLNKSKFSSRSFFDFWETNFDDPNEGRTLKITLIENLLKRHDDGRYIILNHLLENNFWSGIPWDFVTLILYAWEAKSISESEVLKLLFKLRKRGIGIDDLLIKLPPSLWLQNLELYEHSIPILAKKLDVFVLDEFWTASNALQQAWLTATGPKQGYNCDETIFLMLNRKNGLFAQEILQLFGERAFDSIFAWMLKTNNELLQEWQYLIVLNPSGAFRKLCQLPKFNVAVLNLFLRNVSPTTSEWKKIPVNDFRLFFSHLESLNDKQTKSGIYTYFLTSCFTANINHPELVAQFIFQPLHNCLEGNVFDKDSWQRFKMELGRDLYVLLELDFFSKFFRDREEVPDWDRCEFLRRSLLSSFLKFSWDIEVLLIMVGRESTFEKVLQFGVDVKPIRKLLKNLRRQLENRRQTENKYYRILKREL